MNDNKSRPVEALQPLLARLRADGGKYLLSVGLTPEEYEAQPQPTHGGKGRKRWLTDAEYEDLCSFPDYVHSEEFVTMFLGFMCADLPELHTLECPKVLESWQRFKAEMGKA